MMHPLIKGVAWLSVSKIITKVYFLSITIYIANLLSPSDYALFGIGMLMIGLMNLITEFGLGDALVQRKRVTNEEIASVLWCATFSGLLISMICFFLSQFVESFFDKPGVASIIKALSVILFLKSCYIVPYKLMTRKMRFRVKAIVDSVSKLLSISSAGIFAFLGYGVWSLVYAQIINALMITILSYSCEPFRPRIIMSFNDIADMVKFGFNMIGLKITWYFRNSIDSIIGGKFLDKTDFGHYSFGFKLTTNMRDIVQSVMDTVSLPILARKQNNDEQLNRTYLLLVKYYSLLIFPIFIIGMILSEEIIKVFLSAKWMPIINVFRIACFVQMLSMMNSTNETLFISVGKPQVSLKINMMIFAALIFTFLWSVNWGMQGLLLSLVIIMPIIFIVWTSFLLYHRNIQLSLYLRSIYPALLSSVAMSAVVYILKNVLLLQTEIPNRFQMAMNLFILASLGGMTYISTAYLFDRTIIVEMMSSKA